MSIYHLSIKPVQRSKGRSVTSAIAYRAGCVIHDKRTGQKFDYTKKQGVIYSEIIVPTGVNIPSREELWNNAELAEKRKDACTGREYEVNLPFELSDEQRISLCQDFSKYLCTTHGIAVDFSIHKPTPKDIKAGADPRNYHAHIMTTTRKIGNDGLTEKADIEKAGRKRKDDLQATRKAWADFANKHLEMAGLEERIDHRSYVEQGKDQTPTIKMGWQATALERQGIQSHLGNINREIQAKNTTKTQLANEIAELKYAVQTDRDIKETDRFIEEYDNLLASRERQIDEFEQKTESTNTDFGTRPGKLIIGYRATLQESAGIDRTEQFIERANAINERKQQRINRIEQAVDDTDRFIERTNHKINQRLAQRQEQEQAEKEKARQTKEFLNHHISQMSSSSTKAFDIHFKQIVDFFQKNTNKSKDQSMPYSFDIQNLTLGRFDEFFIVCKDGRTGVRNYGGYTKSYTMYETKDIFEKKEDGKMYIKNSDIAYDIDDFYPSQREKIEQSLQNSGNHRAEPATPAPASKTYNEPKNDNDFGLDF